MPNRWNGNRFHSCSKSWSEGDFTGDGVADGSDFNLWSANRFTAVAEASAAALDTGKVPRASARQLITLFAAVELPKISDVGSDVHLTGTAAGGALLGELESLLGPGEAVQGAWAVEVTGSYSEGDPA